MYRHNPSNVCAGVSGGGGGGSCCCCISRTMTDDRDDAECLSFIHRAVINEKLLAQGLELAARGRTCACVFTRAYTHSFCFAPDRCRRASRSYLSATIHTLLLLRFNLLFPSPPPHPRPTILSSSYTQIKIKYLHVRS